VRLIFTRTALEQYLSHTDRKLIKRINELIADVMRNGYSIGKPKPLRGELWVYEVNRSVTVVDGL
jgi:toxin YoeB